MNKPKLKFVSCLVVLGFISMNCKRPPDCSKIQNGKFFYYSKVDRQKVYIERKDSLQIEIDTKKNLVLKSKVVWENDCKFYLFVNALSETKLNRDDSLLSTKSIPIEIINVTSDFYICHIKFSTSKKTYDYTDTMFIQK